MLFGGFDSRLDQSIADYLVLTFYSATSFIFLFPKFQALFAVEYVTLESKEDMHYLSVVRLYVHLKVELLL
jgi:hypothetical protein